MSTKHTDFSIKGEILPTLISLLEDGQVFAIYPQGESMFPFFIGGRDTLYIKKAISPLSKGDIALYRRADGTYVVHRVHHITQENGVTSYYMLGDHQIWIEGPLNESQIYGVVSSYVRRGKTIDCYKNKKYIFLWKIWMFLRPIRPVFCTVWDCIWKLRDRFRK